MTKAANVELHTHEKGEGEEEMHSSMAAAVKSELRQGQPYLWLEACVCACVCSVVWIAGLASSSHAQRSKRPLHSPCHNVPFTSGDLNMLHLDLDTVSAVPDPEPVATCVLPARLLSPPMPHATFETRSG